MALIQSITFFILWLVIIPLFSGVLLVSVVETKHKRPSSIYLCGWLLMIAIFQIIGSACVFMGKPLSTLTVYFSSVMFVCTVAGLFLVVYGLVNRTFSENFKFHNIKNISLINRLTWLLFVLMLAFQLVVSYFLEMPNGDDAYYISIALMADKLDGLFVLSPYTGYTEELNFRHAMSQFPIFYAFLAHQSGVHVAIVAHRIIPLVFVVITYLIYYKAASALFDDDENKVPIFMVLISGVQLFGASSIYSNEVFFLTRTWQGKSILANIAIPASFVVLLQISKCTENMNKQGKRWIGYLLILSLVNIIGGFASGLGLLLLVIYESIVLTIIALRNKKMGVILGGMVSMIPSAIYIFLYVFGR